MKQVSRKAVVHFFFMSRALYVFHRQENNTTQMVDDEVYTRKKKFFFYVCWGKEIDLKSSISPNQILSKPKTEEVDKCLMWTLFQMAFVSTPFLSYNNDVCQKGWKQSSINRKFALPCSLTMRLITWFIVYWSKQGSHNAFSIVFLPPSWSDWEDITEL